MKIWLPVIVVWDIFANFFWNGLSALHGFTWLEVTVVIAVYYAILLGEYVGLYLHGFRSPKIWSKTT